MNTSAVSYTLPIPPLAVTFAQLSDAMQPLHLGDKAWLGRLHDVWKRGAWTPESGLYAPAVFDERQADAVNAAQGNNIRRVLALGALAEWIEDAARARGIPISPELARLVAAGKL